MKAGYSTNSFGDVDPLDALSLLCEQGYASLAITPDRNILNPYEKTFASEVRVWQHALAKAQMRCVVETGARHLLDSKRKHHPTLLSDAQDDCNRRIEFLRRAIELAGELNADCVSLWSGAVCSDADETLLWRKLTDGVGEVLDHASRCGVVLGFEPEPGMFIDTVARAEELFERLGRPKSLGLTVDIGHLECLGERPLAATVRDVADRIVNVHLDDMIVCRHEHLPLGKGDIDYVPIFRELLAARYQGGLHVELPRQSHRWYETAKESYEFIHRMIGLVS
ncbi:MAG: sugar phosphate isomerase/epimerase [Planctomycetes bacterium]|nr:sugar phosphate isomerase/epimerase [Planctomycetota bacterium]MBL6910358.1 sugar phosphate isomerase/epimerase [Pirellulales bacterium]